MLIFKPCHVAVAALLVSAAPAFAQDQEGLVNISVEGNTVQVPVAVAANVCDLDVNVIAQDFAGTQDTACEIDQATAAENNIGSAPGAGGGDQEGLVNVAVDDNVVQVPVGIAANVCDVDANVLANDFVGTEETACTIDQETAAANNIGTGPGAGGGGGNQEGLVNLSVDGNTVQVPIGIAANVCDVEANVLASDFAGTENSVCEIDQATAAENNIGMDAAGGEAANTDAAAGTVEETTDTVEDAADAAADTAEDTADDAADTAEDVAGDAADTVEDAADDAADTAEDAAD